jgi:DNA-binding GntR family transcriptional regulator
MTPASRVETLADQISQAIMTGEYPVGAWLRQETLAERFGVSRQPVREALRHVQASGMVAVYPHRGAMVRGPSPREVREAYLVRAELEGLATELATDRVSADALVRLREAESAFRQSVNEAIAAADDAELHGARGWGAANDAFHETILNAADVPRLAETIRWLHRAIPRNLTWAAMRTPARLVENVRQHETIRAAIENGNARLAREAMTVHVRSSGELVAAWFEQQQGDAAVDDRNGGRS